MAPVSDSGIAVAAPATAAPAPIGRAHRFVRRLSAALILVALLPGAAPDTETERHAHPAPAEQTARSGVMLL